MLSFMKVAVERLFQPLFMAISQAILKKLEWHFKLCERL